MYIRIYVYVYVYLYIYIYIYISAPVPSRRSAPAGSLPQLQPQKAASPAAQQAVCLSPSLSRQPSSPARAQQNLARFPRILGTRWTSWFKVKVLKPVLCIQICCGDLLHESVLCSGSGSVHEPGILALAALTSSHSSSSLSSSVPRASLSSETQGDQTVCMYTCPSLSNMQMSGWVGGLLVATMFLEAGGFQLLAHLLHLRDRLRCFKYN